MGDLVGADSHLREGGEGVGDEVAAPAAAKADDFSALLKASGYLESLPVHEHDLERVSVTYTEDDRRNWKGQRERA